jgi:prepilin-type N-terminal cleavage/methylation domain-containing protein
MKKNYLKQQGYTLVELLITLLLSVIIIVPLYQALNESLLVKTNTKAMNDLQQQSRFALSKLDYLISKDFKLIESISANEIRGQSIYETTQAAGAYRAVSIKVCNNNLIYSVKGVCFDADNQILANNVASSNGFKVQDLRAANPTLYEQQLIGFNLKLKEVNGPNSVDATAKFILGGA